MAKSTSRNLTCTIILNPPGCVEHDEGSLDVSELAVKVGVDEIEDIVSGGKADQEEQE